jgi:hypothetical protein
MMNYRSTIKYGARVIAAAFFGAISMTAGCVGSSAENAAISAVHSRNDSNIKRAANLYYSYWIAYNGAGPKDQQALEGYAKAMPAEQTEWMGVDRANPGATFVSERDHKPFKVRWNIPGDRYKIDALVFEDEGVGGKRMVGFSGSHVESVDANRYDDLWEHGGMPLGFKANKGLEEMPGTQEDNAAKQK